jgi:hypothetical protein
VSVVGCARNDCSAAAVYYPRLLIPLRGPKEQPAATTTIPVPLCEKHGETVKVDDLLTDEGWAALCSGLRKSGFIPVGLGSQST